MVRRICVEKIAVTKPIMKALITRTRDTKAEVRLAAFTRLTKYPKHLKISDRQTIIRNGFYDSCARVKSYVTHKLIPAWLLEYDNDYIQFFKIMRMDSNEKELKETNDVTKFVLDVILKRNQSIFQDFVDMLQIGEERFVPLEHLSIDSIILWSHLISFLRKSDQSEDLLWSILPDLVAFADYIQRYEKLQIHTNLERDFILQQLFMVMQGYDLSDPFSCNALNNLVHSFLTELDLSVNVIESITKNLEKSIPNANNRLIFISQIIENLRYASVAEEILSKEKEVASKISEVQHTLDRLRQDQVQVIQDQDFETAAKNHTIITELEKIIVGMKASLEVKEDIPLDSDPVTLIKCLKVLLAVLKSPQTTTLTPLLHTLMDELILVNLTNVTNEALRTIALECYTLCCLIDETTAKKGIQIFCVCLITNANVEVDLRLLIIAIKATADLLTWYGPDLMKNCVTTEAFPAISINDIIQVLVDIMDHEEIEVEEVAIKGLCNLILLERIHSPSLISRMVLKWCNPATDEDISLKQEIGAMLEELPTLQNAEHQLEKSVLITIKTILQAPAASPLSEVNIQDIIKFCLTLCNICAGAASLNYHLAVNLCCEIKDHPNNEDNIILSKMLLLLETNRMDKFMVEDLLHICEEVVNEVPASVEVNMIKFISQLEKTSELGDVDAEVHNESIEV